RIGEARGSAAMWGLEFVKRPRTKEPAVGLARAVRTAGLQHGLILLTPRFHHNCIRLPPPIRIPPPLIDTALRLSAARLAMAGAGQPPFRGQAVQRTARGHGELPERPREDAEGVRGGRDRGAEGSPGPARGGRVPPVAERAGPVRGGPRPGGMGDAMGHGGRISRGDAMSQFANTNTRDVTFRREREPAEGRDPARCPNCGSFALYVDPVRGERVCDNCGFVVDEALVDQGPDWTTFEGDDRIRAGPPPSVMAPDKGLGSMVGNGRR